jgi:hypothetical protein
MRNLTKEEITRYYLQCHGPNLIGYEAIDEWEARMLDLIGPDDCKFLIRSLEPHLRGLWLGKFTNMWALPVWNALHFDWGDAAVKCSNRKTLEAVRITGIDEAVDSKGNVIYLNPTLDLNS